MEAEFARIDKNGGGQILFSEFVDWALEKNLDIEDDIDEDWHKIDNLHVPNWYKIINYLLHLYLLSDLLIKLTQNI